MANTFKNAAKAVGNTNTTLYTCPASTTAVIHAVFISNVDGTNDATIDVLVTDNSAGSDFYIMKTVNVPADSSLVIEFAILSLYLGAFDTSKESTASANS